MVIRVLLHLGTWPWPDHAGRHQIRMDSISLGPARPLSTYHSATARCICIWQGLAETWTQLLCRNVQQDEAFRTLRQVFAISRSSRHLVGAWRLFVRQEARPSMWHWTLHGYVCIWIHLGHKLPSHLSNDRSDGINRGRKPSHHRAAVGITVRFENRCSTIWGAGASGSLGNARLGAPAILERRAHHTQVSLWGSWHSQTTFETVHGGVCERVKKP